LLALVLCGRQDADVKVHCLSVQINNMILFGLLNALDVLDNKVPHPATQEDLA
jgi:hypothetical protein